MSDVRGYPNKAHRFGRLVLTTCLQGGGAPVIDGCIVHCAEGARAVGVAVKPRPSVGRAVVVAWVSDGPGPVPYRWPVPKALTRTRGHLA